MRKNIPIFHGGGWVDAGKNSCCFFAIIARNSGAQRRVAVQFVSSPYAVSTRWSQLGVLQFVRDSHVTAYVVPTKGAFCYRVDVTARFSFPKLASPGQAPAAPNRRSMSSRLPYSFRVFSIFQL